MARRDVVQAAAIPYRRRADRVEICLVTSRNTGAWTFPKGTIDEGYDARETALKEAQEEAGLHGALEGAPVGTYEYPKWGRRLTVEVHLMRVDEVAAEWDEQDSRERRWFTPLEAHAALPHAVLRALLITALQTIGVSVV
jgi:8-oxo-dGTP pyrophosphatase MutT (NUDIX family)